MRGRNFNALGSLSGHASSMIGSLKNNLRSKVREKFNSSSKITPKKTFIDPKKATPEQLQEIRERLQKENRKNLVFTLTFTIVLTSILFILFNYVKF